MAIKAGDLNPRPSHFMLGGKRYELKKFSLSAQVWAMDEFATIENKNGIANLNHALRNFMQDGLKAFFVCIHYLLKDDSDFPTVNMLMDAVEKEKSPKGQEGGKYLKIVDLHNALCECIGVSQSKVDEIHNELEAKKSKATARAS